MKCQINGCKKNALNKRKIEEIFKGIHIENFNFFFCNSHTEEVIQKAINELKDKKSNELDHCNVYGKTLIRKIAI